LNKDEIDRIPRKTAEEVLSGVPPGPGVEQRTKLAVEVAMNLEWWRGYHAALAEVLAARKHEEEIIAQERREEERWNRWR
jgi:hypothetical protein